MMVTSLLNRCQNLFEDQRIELAEELDDRDDEDTGVCSWEDLIRCMKLCQITVGTFDDDIIEFLQYLAMRHSKSLEEI
jgi:hypothetical protein